MIFSQTVRTGSLFIFETEFLEVFGSFTWNPECEKFIYLAEKKPTENEQKFNNFIEKETFGERLQNVKEPILCLFEVKLMKIVEVIQLESSPFFAAQPAFIDNDSIVFMGIQRGAKKLGMTYIYCRPTSIYTMTLSSKSIGNHKEVLYNM